MSDCRVCGGGSTTELLAFGSQPICNRFLSHRDEPQAMFPLAIGQCPRCGTVQRSAGPPADELRPRVNWITYQEPEQHLDELADRLVALPGIGRDSQICGMSFKDDSLLQRLRERGVQRAWRIDVQKDLGVAEAGAGVETVQARINGETGRALAAAHGPSDVILARHIFEHVYDLAGFMDGVRALASPRARLVLEVPDCERSLVLCDYTMVWEEHMLYLTQETFRSSADASGVELEQLLVYPYPLERSLVGIGRLQARRAPGPWPAEALHRERDRAQVYASRFGEIRERVKAILAGCRRERGPVAMLGAGHLGAMFINAFELHENIACVVDDHPSKRGLFMPGSGLAVVGSEVLVAGEVKLCLLSVNPGREEGVLSHHHAFVEQGGEFASIFPGSRLYLGQLMGATR